MGILSWIFGRNRLDYPGIYRIYNKKTGAMYIGSTARTMRLRWEEHRERLNNGLHANPVLQQDWDRFGEGAFEFNIVEIVADERSLFDREQIWISKVRETNPCYNSRASGNSDQRYRYKLLRQQGVKVPYPPPPDVSEGELLYLFSLAQLSTGEWAWIPEELASLFHSKSFPKWQVIKQVEQYRQAPTPRPANGWH